MTHTLLLRRVDAIHAKAIPVDHSPYLWKAARPSLDWYHGALAVGESIYRAFTPTYKNSCPGLTK
jgi:hypothetical protein